MGKLSAIFYDIDDTLYSTTEFASRARQQAVESMVAVGLKLPAAVVRRELDEVIGEFTSNYPNHFDKLLQRLPKESWSGTNRALIIAAGVMAYHASKAELLPFPDVRPFLEAVAGQTDVIQGIITHGLEIKQAEKLLLLKLTPFLHPEAIFISDQMGISKPNPKLYARACRALGLEPSEVMYVGDSPLHDIDPPNGLGMITVRVLRENRFKDVRGATEPRYTISSFAELPAVLREDFDVELEA